MFLTLGIFSRKPQLGRKLLMSLIGAFSLFSLFIHVKYEFSLAMDVFPSLINEVYVAPWVRISPYLMGTLAAIYLHQNGGSIKMTKVILQYFILNLQCLIHFSMQKTRLTFWFVCFVMFIVLMTGPLLKSASVFVASLMKIIAHIDVAFVFCWIIVCDKSGFRNTFISFLSKDVFNRYAKTTYALYLVAPVVVMLLYGISENSGTYSFPEIVSKMVYAL